MTRSTARKLTDRRRNLGVGMLSIESLRIDPAIQQRVAMVEETVDEYAERYLDGEDAPPVVAFEDADDPGEGCWIADGFHRVAGATKAGRTEILADLRRGTRRDAVLYSLGANEGLRRTNADKRKAVTTALQDGEWRLLSNREIARLCGVSHLFVGNIRLERARGRVNAETPPEVATVATESGESGDSSVTPPLTAYQRELDGLLGGAAEPVEARQLALPPLPDRCGVLHPVHDLPCTEAVGHTWSHGYRDGPDRIGWRNTEITTEQLDAEMERPRPPASSPATPAHEVRSPAGTPDVPVLGRRASQNWTEVADEIEDPDTEERVEPLPNDERAPLDGYYTPLATARACVQWLVDHVLFGPDAPGKDGGEGGREFDPCSAVEPSVGGGSWVAAMHELLPDWKVDRVDIDPEAPGLELGLVDREDAVVADWLKVGRGRMRRNRWRLCLGNRPYEGEIAPWVETCLQRAEVVALLERQTITGDHIEQGRLDWWLAHRPAWVIAVEPRPKWEGPGRRPQADKVGSVLIVWIRGVTETRWDWIDCREGT